MARQFLIASLLTAGFGHTSPDQDRLAAVSIGGGHNDFVSPVAQARWREHTFNMGGHSSHSSHSSHRSSSGGSSGHYSHMSHTSHRSSAGGGYDDSGSETTYVPTYPSSTSGNSSGSTSESSSSWPGTPVTPRSQGFIAPQATTGSGESSLPPLSGRTERFKKVVCRVQLALTARDYYSGPIDCVVGPQLRNAIRRLQSDFSMALTGTITPEVLDRLMVPTD